MNNYEPKEPGKPSYGKRPLWQWILIYLLVGGIVYLIIFYLLGLY